MKIITSILVILSLSFFAATTMPANSPAASTLPPLPPMPEIPPDGPIDSVPMGDSKSAPEVKLDLPIESGPYEPTWESIEKNYPGTPAWLREAKFGIWVEWHQLKRILSSNSGKWNARC